MAALIDASVLIDAERGNLNFDRLVSEDSGGGYAISAVAASELLHGLWRAVSTAQRIRRRNFIEAVLARLPVVPFDLLVARVHAELTATLLARGSRVGAHDAMIAATALAHSFAVITRDLRSFPKIPGLKTIRV
ncbi:MAG: PIN domain-containing protein [Candidatus Binataceae bacterium]